ncbi:MAG: type II 3-dehydroquinate dehydratase [Pseudomonadota bacterium]
MATQKPIFILNGPNLNLLGTREPEQYGNQTLADIEAECRVQADERGLAVDFRQSNHEGQLVDWLHEANETACAVILNAGALTHTSLALGDALRGIHVPVVEVHISNVHAREPVRHHSHISAPAAGIIVGFGTMGYGLAIDAVARWNKT